MYNIQYTNNRKDTCMKKKITKAGVLRIFTGFRNIAYVLFTKEDFYRGGKKRNKKKTLLVLSGSIKSYTFVDGKEIEEVLHGLSLRVIPAHVPHQFYTTRKSWVIEWWNKNYTEEKFPLFYDRKK